MRGIVFDEDAARDIERRLRRDGYAVTVGRERFAGEDDDEDHAWAVETDAPLVALELLLDAHDGWLDDSAPGWAPGWAPGGAPGGAQRDAPIRPATPLQLPDAPRRRHRD